MATAARQVENETGKLWTVEECEVMDALKTSNGDAFVQRVQRVTGPTSEHIENATAPIWQRPFLICPVCNQRKGKLYRPPGPEDLTEWACKKCHHLTTITARTHAGGKPTVAGQLVKDLSLLQKAFDDVERYCSQLHKR